MLDLLRIQGQAGLHKTKEFWDQIYKGTSVTQIGQDRLRKIIQFPLTRIIVATLTLVGIRRGTYFALEWFTNGGPLGDKIYSNLIFGLSGFLVTYISYCGFVHYFERRPVTELGLRGCLQELGIGMSLGLGLITLVICILWILSLFEVNGRNPVTLLLFAIPSMLFYGFWEESLLRGVVFRITEEKLGSWLALFLSSILFGFAHMWNPNATVMSSIAIALEAGVLLGAAFMITRRLWFPTGIHVGWNLTLGKIFGATVSGIHFQGVLKSKTSGLSWLSGGDFGPEASLISLIVCLVVGTCLLALATKKHRFIEPFWKSKRKVTR